MRNGKWYQNAIIFIFCLPRTVVKQVSGGKKTFQLLLGKFSLFLEERLNYSEGDVHTAVAGNYCSVSRKALYILTNKY